MENKQNTTKIFVEDLEEVVLRLHFDTDEYLKYKKVKK